MNSTDLAMVIAQRTVDNDLGFVRGDVPVRPPLPRHSASSRRSRHQPKRSHPNGQSEQGFDEEHPSPPGVTSYTPHLEQADGQETGDHGRKVVDNPEEGESDGQLGLGVEVRKIEDRIRYVPALEKCAVFERPSQSRC